MKLLRPEAAAKMMDCSIATVYRLVADGKLGHIRLSPRIRPRCWNSMS